MNFFETLKYKPPTKWEHFLPPDDLFIPDETPTEEMKSKYKRQADTVLSVVSNCGVDCTSVNYMLAPQMLRVNIQLSINGAVAASSRLNRIAKSVDLAIGVQGSRCLIENGLTVEIPANIKQTVRIRRLFEFGFWEGMDTPLWIGVDGTNTPLIIDLAKAPHLLIAGATGSGKSVCINSILASILKTSGSSKTELMLIDPKQVEFTPYKNNTLLCAPVATTPQAAIDILIRAYRIMERRYAELAARGLRSIDEARQDYSRVVVVIDELANLMFSAKKQTEGLIENIAAKGRAAGVHLIVATQNPTVKVITGRIKANIPSRIAFTTASITDSRVILDYGGAEKLTGAGDGLYKSPTEIGLIRFQGALITDDEVHKMNEFDRTHNRITPPTWKENFITQMKKGLKNKGLIA